MPERRVAGATLPAMCQEGQAKSKAGWAAGVRDEVCGHLGQLGVRRELGASTEGGKDEGVVQGCVFKL